MTDTGSKPPPIHRLDPALTALIAAGEVAERPATIVKELVENSLDARATSISVEVSEGGLRLIRVSDDGHGIPRAEAALAVEAFTSNKIRQPDDLQRLRSLGFRGEALNSIAAVAELDLLTRTTTEVEGSAVQVRGGEVTVQAAASPVGMRVTVQNLFARQPARRKFLKSPLRELELIQQTLIRYALAYPQVAFRLLADGQPRLSLPPGSALERIGGVLGRDVAAAVIPVQWEALDLKIEGYISHPDYARSRRDREYFFVNGRPIRAGLLAVMLERPYLNYLPPGRYPLAVLHIQLDPGFVDINVHPQKSEVRFSRERSIYGTLTQAVQQSLAGFPPARFAVDGEAMVWPFANVPPGELLRENPPAYGLERLQALAQIHETYILAQAEQQVLIFDQHTAHEQILYEGLLQPGHELVEVDAAPWLLSATESDLLNQHLPLFTELGFSIDPFGERRFRLRSLPALLQPNLENQVITRPQPAANALLTTLLETLQAHRQAEPERQRDMMAQKAACVCAIKAGDYLDLPQMQSLLDALLQVWSPAACPHGRPIFIILSKEEVERRFHRR